MILLRYQDEHHFNKFQGIINELLAMGINFDDEMRRKTSGSSSRSLIISLKRFGKEKTEPNQN